MTLKCLTRAVMAVTLAAGMTTMADSGSSSHAVGINLTSFGPGVFYTYKFNDNFHLRTTANGIATEDSDIELSGIDYEGDFDSSAVGVMLDWYPMSNGWKRNIFISGGIMYSEMEFDGNAESKIGEDIFVGGTRVSPGDISSLDLKIEYEQAVNPYLSIGWGNKIAGRRGFAFVSELGLMKIDDPDITLTAIDPNGILSESDIQVEKDSILDDADGLTGFLSVGVSYHF